MEKMMSKQIVNKDLIITPTGTMEDFNRPSHSDFATSTELKDKGFSGIRHNSLTEACEIWMLGEVRASVSPAMVEINPHAINEAIEEVFALNEVRPYNPTLISYKANRKIN